VTGASLIDKRSSLPSNNLRVTSSMAFLPNTGNVRGNHMMVIAHRGASSYAPENTLAAFDLALELGARHIELDVTFSSDGHVAVIHDDDIDRTTNGSGPVMSHSLAALRGFNAGSWFGSPFAGQRIPTFNEVLKRYKGRAHLHTEIKGRSPKLAQRTADLIRENGMAGDVTITSFQRIRLEEMRAYAPELPAGWLVTEASDAVIAQARALGLVQICPQADSVTPELVSRLHAEGFLVRAWGVTTETLMRQVVQAKADGMTVNFPDKLIAHLRTQESRS
jgi:glycerophosphoryl diester phosphodiesterase